MIVLAGACLLLVGVMLGKVQPSGSTAEVVVKFLWDTPWATLVLVALAGYAMILFRIKK